MFEATLRYNSNRDKQTIEGTEECLDSLLVPGKMVAANEKAIPAGLKKYQEESGVKYYIEPTVIDFRVGSNFRDENGIRSWHWAYVEAVGPALEEPLTERTHVDASDLERETVESITAADIEFQETFVPEKVEEYAGKYETIDEPDTYQPAAVIPWFHKVRSHDDLAVNEVILDAADDAATMSLKPCLFTTKGFIRVLEQREALVDLLRNRTVDECFLWVEALGKHDTRESDYVAVAELVSALAEAGVTPHFYYGDYFATLLSHVGAGGTTYGVMYGEEAVEQQERKEGGGILSRYYVPQVKDFIQIPATVDIQQRVGAEMCECDVCQRQFDTWQDLAERQESDENIQTPIEKHHLRVRWRQIRAIEEGSIDSSLEALDEAYSKYTPAFAASNQVSGTKALDYLPRWRSAVEEVTTFR